MTKERWQQIEQLYHAARERGGEVLEGADPSLRQEVERLLSEDSGGKLLDGAAADLLTETTTAPVMAGTQLGPYRIEAPIGAGGMGHVFRATDTRLGRTVAIKISKSQFSERFEREAKAISALNHPHICTLYDVGPNYLVMEFAEGETLAARLKRGKLNLADGLTCGIQIAGALAAAHARGIIHRDLKPGNIMLTKSGAKLLDFGLAKRTRAADTNSIATDLTGQGAVFGTVPYMAPEQIEGKEADARSDIFAFGAVMYEMLAGARPFSGDTTASLMASILQHDPPPLPASCPPSLGRVIRRCLTKDPEQRWQSAQDLKAELEWNAQPPSAQKDTKPRRLIPWLAAAVASLAAVLITVFYFRQFPTQDRVLRLDIAPPESGQSFGFHAVSPDGQWVAFVAAAPNKGGQLYVRRLDSTLSRALTTAPMQGAPFWSPDSRWIGFFSGNRLMKIGVEGGAPQDICAAPGSYAEGTWGAKGVILFHTGPRRSLYRVEATGGEAKPVFDLDPSRQETTHSNPQFLPDGSHFIFFVQSGRTENRGVYAASLDSEQRKRLLNTDRNAIYAESQSGAGFLLFMQGATLMSQRFDAHGMLLEGPTQPIAEGIAAIRLADIAPAVISASNNGVLTFRQGSAGEIGELAWFDRQGKRLGTVGESAEYNTVALSGDESKLAVARMNPQTATNDLWLFDLRRGGSWSRFTFGPADEINPVWSPDGSQIVFCSTEKGAYDIYRKASSGSGEAEVLLETGEKKFPTDWSPDRRLILFNLAGQAWALPLAGPGKPYPFLPTGSTAAKISPNGRWVAYLHEEIYVQSVNPSGGVWQVSKGAGRLPFWRKDGKELFYLDENNLMAVEVETQSETFRAGTPHMLFALRPSVTTGARYQVAANGQRFLVINPIETPPSPITVAVNWTAGLRK